MARRGRPPGGDSEATRASIVDTARKLFANRGFAATTVAALAHEADLAPSAIYHYFGGKAELYEAVFEATADGVWSRLGSSITGQTSMIAALEILMANARETSAHPHHNSFLALVPVEARLHPEFAHLLDRRSKYQDATFSAMARLGLDTGELAGFTEEQATEVLRAIAMGWFFEQYFRGGEIPGSADAILTLFRKLAA